jgi:mRNA interferase HigB
MKVIGLHILDAFQRRHPVVRSWVGAWVADAKGAKWTTSHDIKSRYASASFLSNNKVVFNVKGNDFRLVTQIAYPQEIVLIKWAGTHAEYDKVNWEDVSNES